jgi:hypothetical protein
MSYVIDMKWLILLSLFPSAAFVSWVFWNLTREIWAERRQWVRKYPSPMSPLIGMDGHRERSPVR